MNIFSSLEIFLYGIWEANGYILPIFFKSGSSKFFFFNVFNLQGWS